MLGSLQQFLEGNQIKLNIKPLFKKIIKPFSIHKQIYPQEKDQRSLETIIEKEKDQAKVKKYANNYFKAQFYTTFRFCPQQLQTRSKITIQQNIKSYQETNLIQSQQQKLLLNKLQQIFKRLQRKQQQEYIKYKTENPSKLLKKSLHKEQTQQKRQKILQNRMLNDAFIFIKRLSKIQRYSFIYNQFINNKKYLCMIRQVQLLFKQINTQYGKFSFDEGIISISKTNLDYVILYPFLFCPHKIKQIQILQCDFREDVQFMIFEMIQKIKINIQRIEFHKMKISQQIIKKISSFIKSNNTLKTLALVKCGMKSKYLCQIALGLAYNTSIECLNFIGNQLDNSSINTIITVLRYMKNLKKLFLKGNKIQKDQIDQRTVGFRDRLKNKQIKII